MLKGETEGFTQQQLKPIPPTPQPSKHLAAGYFSSSTA
jgi:hypothetical protein